MLCVAPPRDQWPLSSSFGLFLSQSAQFRARPGCLVLSALKWGSRGTCGLLHGSTDRVTSHPRGLVVPDGVARTAWCRRQTSGGPAMSFNTVTVTGNVVADPVLRTA